MPKLTINCSSLQSSINTWYTWQSAWNQSANRCREKLENALCWLLSDTSCNRKMAESREVICDQDQAESGEIVAKVKKFLQDGCRCSQGLKGGQCSRQFRPEAVMANVNNCLKLSHAQLDLVVLANIQACTSFEVPGEKCKKSKVQFPILIPSCLQGYVSTSLCNELLAVLPIKGTLRKSWDFTKSPWQQH